MLSCRRAHVGCGFFGARAMARGEEAYSNSNTHIKWHIAGPLVHVAYDRLHARRYAVSPATSDCAGQVETCVARRQPFSPSRITTLSSPPPASQAKIIVNLLAGHVRLAAASHSNKFNCTCNYCQQQCLCLVCSIASLYCPTQFACLPVRCLISPRLAYRPSCARPYHTWYPVLAGWLP